MQPPSRTPEGKPNQCPVCGASLNPEPSQPAGDATCPNCGSLVWFPANDADAEGAIFGEALNQPESERGEYLDSACRDNASLRARVEALLAAHEDPDSLLDNPGSEIAETVLYASVSERPGIAIGRYKLREQIGEGGMGGVFVAQQERPVRRKAALKVIKPGMDTNDVIARFEAERQALALMDHPNIARVLDAGSTMGLPVRHGRPTPSGTWSDRRLPNCL